MSSEWQVVIAVALLTFTVIILSACRSSAQRERAYFLARQRQWKRERYVAANENRRRN